MMKHLQKLGKAMMLPVAALPICGILMGLGYALAPAVMGAAGATEGFAYVLGFFLIKAGAALIDNMAILFAIGTAVGLAKENNGTAGLAGLVSWLMMTTLVSATGAIIPALAANPTWALAYSKIANPFTGILAGIVGGICYNKFKDTKLPDFLAFFSGKRCVAIVTGVAGGIGKASALMLAEKGYTVVGMGRSECPDLSDFDELDITYVSGDILSAEDRRRLFDTAIAKGEISILVNVAGVAPKVRSDLLEMTEESYDYVMNINTKGTLFLTQLAANYMNGDAVVDFDLRGIPANEVLEVRITDEEKNFHHCCFLGCSFNLYGCNILLFRSVCNPVAGTE